MGVGGAPGLAPESVMTERALLFTDVVDSTRLVERLGDARAAQVWAEHDRRARDLLVAHAGREIDRSDGFLLLFDAAADAARYALAYHQALADLDVSARVGLHVGAVTLRDNPPDDVARGAKRTEVEGLAKPFAARIMALARGGQTLLSAAARAALGGALPAGTGIESHGHYRLKGVDAPVEVFELGAHGRCAFAPPHDTDKAYRVVRAGEFWRPVREVRHNLPAERDAFIGRTAELHALALRLDAGTRLLTILGPGGTGKTRFVRRYGWAWLGDWPGGVYFCDLSEARSLDGIFFAVASALDVPLGKEDPAVQLGHAIAGRGRCLVILDNFEQVVENAGATVGRWADRAADAAFIVTSRERLHLPGEEVLPLEPLPVAHEAVELFAIRARAQRPDFVLGDANRAAVAEVVRLLDGLPLAIELAAARVRVLSPAQLVERMRDRFALLAGARGPAARQATLRAAIDWSWDLLTPWEQAALAQCSVFEGGFALEAAEAVLDLTPWSDAPPAIDAVQALVDKSLLRTWVRADQGRYDLNEPYFGMYLSIHEYAAQKLLASGSGAQCAAEEHHERYFASFGTEEALDALSRHGGVKRRRALALELDNLVAACRRAVGRGDSGSAVAAYRAAWEVLDLHGPFALGVALGAQVLAIDGIETSLRAAALMTRAFAAWRAGRMDEAGTWFEQALVLAREPRDRRREGNILGNLGNLRREEGRMDEARQYFEASLAMQRELGNRRAEGVVLGNLSLLHHEQGRIEEARAHYEAALTVHREVGDRRFEGMMLGNLANLYGDQGQVEEALAHFDQALAIHREMGNRRSEGIVLGNLGNLQRAQGRMTQARAHFEAALAIARDVGDLGHEGFVLGSLGDLHLAEGRMDEAHAHCDQALVIHRAVGHRRAEGTVLGSLGDLLARQGRIGDAREALRAGEALLRDVGERLELAKLLCIRGRVEVASGGLDQARAALAEAESLAAAAGADAGTELSQAVAKLRGLLA